MAQMEKSSTCGASSSFQNEPLIPYTSLPRSQNDEETTYPLLPFATNTSSLTYTHTPVEDPGFAESERKRKNREFAKKSRAKRRDEQQRLGMELAKLQRANRQLRQLVKQEIPNKAQSILKKCCSDHPLHYAAKSHGHIGDDEDLTCSDFHLLENLIRTQQSFCLTDPSLPDNPIVYASRNFYELTGYSREETLGRNCRFLQGEDTDRKAIALISENIKNANDFTINILNYTRNGRPFWNQFFIAALRDRYGNVVNYVGVQCEIEEPDKSKDSLTMSSHHTRKEQSIRITGHVDVGEIVGKPEPLITEGSFPRTDIFSNPLMEKTLQPLASTTIDLDDIIRSNPLGQTDNESRVDWSILANILEDDFEESIESFDDINRIEYVQKDDGICREKAHLDYKVLSPLVLITKTCRSELVDSILAAKGDVKDPRFLKSLEVLSSIYASSLLNVSSPEHVIEKFLNGSWVSLSRPAYGGCLGENSRGDYMYTLGKMSFNMFKPANLKCSIQHTLNKVSSANNVNGVAPTAIPWSLRRELAKTCPKEEEPSGLKTPLRSYE